MPCRLPCPTVPSLCAQGRYAACQRLPALLNQGGPSGGQDSPLPRGRKSININYRVPRCLLLVSRCPCVCLSLSTPPTYRLSRIIPALHVIEYTMQLPTLLALVASSAWLGAAAPAVNAPLEARTDVRLIKTSPEDPGTWVSEEDKISEYTAKGKHFVDITDINVRTPTYSPSIHDPETDSETKRTPRCSPSCRLLMKSPPPPSPLVLSPTPAAPPARA